MQLVRTQKELETALAQQRDEERSVGFVPTMGALHDGHLSLVRLAQEKADTVVVSIFVNPTQFAPDEDYSTYPRNEEADLAKLEELAADLVYLPSVEALYPDGAVNDRKAGPAAEGLESDFRPGFFDGVVSVVGRLFEHVQPDIAIFGEKDYQQLMVVTEAFPDVTIEGAPTGRDEHGLALSSRNAYLSAEEIEIARQLNVILQNGEDLDVKKQQLLDAGFDEVDYVENRWSRILAAARLGKTRLIDNVGA